MFLYVQPTVISNGDFFQRQASYLKPFYPHVKGIIKKPEKIKAFALLKINMKNRRRKKTANKLAVS